MNTRVRDFYVEMIINLHPNVMVMLGSGCGLRPIKFQGKAKALLNQIQRRVNGRNWYRAASDRRLAAIGFMEHWNTNLHMHLTISAPGTFLIELATSGRRWRGIQHAGD